MKRKIGIFSAMLIGASVYAAEAPKVSGFVHGLGTYTDTDQGGNKGDINFSVNDGAVYFQHQVGGAQVFVDLPFAMGSSATNSFQIDPTSKGQAYVGHTSEGGLRWKLGQWDSPFGLEAADSVDQTFNSSGAVANALPYVHRGWMVGYAVSEMIGVDAFVANPTAFLTGAATAQNEDKLETGLNVSAKMDALTFNIGGMFGRALKKNNYAVFFNTTYDMDALNLGLEVDYLKDKNTTALSTPAKWLSALHLGYDLSDIMSFGFRGEYMTHKDANVWTVTVGPQYDIEKDVTLKADYTLRHESNNFSTGAKGGAKFYTHTVAFGAVARF